MGHTFTYYAFLIKLTKSREKSNIKLSSRRLTGTKKRDVRITVRWIIPYSSSPWNITFLFHSLADIINFTWPTLCLVDLLTVIKRFLLN